MNSGFINRLVGTTIVVVAAIVFIPNILDGEKVHYKETFKPIPERPEFTTIDLQDEIDNKVAVAEPAKKQVIEDVIAEDDKLAAIDELVKSPANDSVATETAAPEREVVTVTAKEAKPINQTVPARSSDENLSKMAYVIQLGSFSHAPNVKSLQKKLSDNGFKNFTRPIKTPNGTLTKVFVGPSLNEQELRSKLPELKQLTKLNGKVTQFEITK